MLLEIFYWIQSDKSFYGVLDLLYINKIVFPRQLSLSCLWHYGFFTFSGSLQMHQNNTNKFSSIGSFSALRKSFIYRQMNAMPKEEAVDQILSKINQN